jgi:DNA replication and repair protein RecF
LRIAVRYRPEEGRNVWVDGVAASGPGALYGRLLAVFFSPDDLWLLKGGPSARRVLVDRLLVQASPLYADAVRRYRQALAQRNAALREVRARRAGRAMLAIWEPQLVQYGGEIMHRRAEAVQALSLLAADVYGDLTGGRETLECRYVPGLGRDGARPVDGQGLAEWRARLEASLSRSGPHDIAMGVTCVGPHRTRPGDARRRCAL